MQGRCLHEQKMHYSFVISNYSYQKRTEPSPDYDLVQSPLTLRQDLIL
jgi:hypothetical protein